MSAFEAWAYFVLVVVVAGAGFLAGMAAAATFWRQR